MAATRKNARSAGGARGGKSSGGRKPAQKLENRAARSVFGLLLMGLAVLMLTSLITRPDESSLRIVRELQQGLAGFLCLVLPFFTFWVGITLAFTRSSFVHAKRIASIFVLLLLLTTCAQLFQIRNIMEYGDPSRAPRDYWSFLRATAEQSSAQAVGGGVLGALLAWPLYDALGVAGGMVVLVALIISDLVILTGVSIADVGDSIAESMGRRREESGARRAERKERRAEYKEARAMEQLRMQQVNARSAPEMPDPEEDAQGRDPQWLDGMSATSKIVPQSGRAKREAKKKRAFGEQAFEEMPEPYAEHYPDPMAGWDVPRGRGTAERLYVETIAPPGEPAHDAPRKGSAPEPWIPGQSGPAREAWQDVLPILEFPNGRERPAGPPSALRGEPSLYIETIAPAGGEEAAVFGGAGAAPPPRQRNARTSPAAPAGDFPWDEEPWDEEPWDEDPQDKAPWDDAPWDEEQETEAQAPAPAERRLDYTPVAIPAAQQAGPPPAPPYRYPPFTLLNPPKKSAKVDTRKQDELNAAKLIETLRSFGIQARVLNITYGPAITRYELQPAPGVKVARIVSLVDDIALNMAAAGVRIEAPIPGKAAVGIEIPNESIATVVLREVLESDEAQDNPSALACALGKDIAGRRVIADLAKMPHVLIAG
ncbi:MAG: hypothetical protein FWE77_06205, partial [Clostridia bacterium]|nr:hypothetical protein [Clostridia bacterium]